jgi:PIN domain nuclease of toxin-antitoxin system
MRLLLDTQVLIWVLKNPERLADATRRAITASETRVFVSMASPWEMAIKEALGNLTPPDELEAHLEEKRFELLPIFPRHARAVAALPHHHGDPFDRMLIAQAQVDGMTLVTSDQKIGRYQVSLMPAF